MSSVRGNSKGGHIDYNSFASMSIAESVNENDDTSQSSGGCVSHCTEPSNTEATL